MTEVPPAPAPPTRLRAQPGPRRDRIRVALVSDHELIAEAVVAALASESFDVWRLPWPMEDGLLPHRELTAAAPDVALLVYEVDSALRMSEAAALIRSWDGPWLVLAGTGRDEIAGGLLAAGAAAVSAKRAGLRAVAQQLRALAAGVQPVPEATRAALVARWRTAERGRQDRQTRLDSLTTRERQILEQLRDGATTRRVAARLDLAESTVRSHVRGILRKLEVNSQLAAVAIVLSRDQDFPVEPDPAGPGARPEPPRVPAPRFPDGDKPR